MRGYVAVAVALAVYSFSGCGGLEKRDALSSISGDNAVSIDTTSAGNVYVSYLGENGRRYWTVDEERDGIGPLDKDYVIDVFLEETEGGNRRAVSLTNEGMKEATSVHIKAAKKLTGRDN